MIATSYQIVEAPQSKRGVTLRGGSLKLWRSKAHEVILSGPADTGKTWAALHKLDALMWKYPSSQAAIVRKTQKSLYGTVCQTFQNKVVNKRAITIYGGDKSPDRYLYPNGSTIWLGGMDNPDKILSSERDFIYTNQTEELSEGDWETLMSRASGRAGNAPYSQLFGDCNPGGSKHWIREREKSGKLLLLNSYHVDNPELYDDNGNLTDSGKVRLATLENLSGIRRKRLLEGIWATAEGVVYDNFSHDIHIKVRDFGEFRWFALACDEGYTNPAVILLIGIDNDTRLHIRSEFYERGKLQQDVIDAALAFRQSHHLSVVAVDASAAGLIADMRNNGLPAQPTKGRVLDGIAQVQALLQVQGDGRPRLTIDPSCINTINELESYVWRVGKDEPVKENDHAMDALRYFITWLYDEQELTSISYEPVRINDY